MSGADSGTKSNVNKSLAFSGYKRLYGQVSKAQAVNTSGFLWLLENLSGLSKVLGFGCKK